MRGRRQTQVARGGFKRPAEFLDSAIRSLAHRLEDRRVFRIVRQIHQFVGILFQIVQELAISLIDIAHVFEIARPHSFKGGNSITHREMFVKGIRPPFSGCSLFDDVLQATALIAIGDLRARPIQECRRQVEIERLQVSFLTASTLGNAWIVDYQGHSQRLLVMRPFARKAAIAHMVAIVCRIDNDGIVRQSLFLQGLDKATDRSIDPAHHAIVGPHIGLVFFGGVPAPEKAFAIDCRLQEIRLRFEDRRIVQSRGSDLNILVHAIHCSWPGEVSDSGTPIAIFRMARVKPHVYRKGLSFRLRLDERDSFIDD